MQQFRRPAYHQLSLWLVVATVLLRVLVPDGFMPERHAGQQGLPLAFCTAGPLAVLNAPAALAADSDFGKLRVAHLRLDGSDHSGTASHPSCAFASAAASGLPFTAGSVPRMQQAIELPARSPGLVAEASPDHLWPPLRGPPRYS